MDILTWLQQEDSKNIQEAPHVEAVNDDEEDMDFIELDDDLQQDLFMKEALDKGVDIKHYAGQLQSELSLLEEDFISDYAEYAQPLSALHLQIKDCDKLLFEMQNILNGFQFDLSKLSTEISTLQAQSMTMNSHLKNRLTVQQQLSVVLDGILITPEIVKSIFNNEVVDPVFQQNLFSLNKKMAFIKQNQNKPIAAYKDIGLEIEGLRLKATEKIRIYFLEKLKLFTLPNANIPILQQSTLLRHKALNHFIIQRHQEAALEIRLNYIMNISSYYYARFSKYVARVQKLQLVVSDKNDLIGVEDSVKRGLFGTGKLNLKDKTSMFTLGDRFNVLLNITDTSVILPHVAEEQGLKYPFESVFHSITRTIMDNSSSEYVFASEFFYTPVRGSKGSPATSAPIVANEVFQEIFTRTLKMISESIKAYADASFDAVGLLLCIRITMQHQRIMQSRCIPCLDVFLNSILLMLWPRFQLVMDMHIQSVKKLGGASLFSAVDVHPHYITRRYSEFACSILVLNEGYNDHMLETSLSRLRGEVESFLMRLTADIPDKKKKLIFFINNYDLMVSVLEATEGQLCQKECNYFRENLEQKIFAYVDEEMLPHFGNMLAFVAELDKTQDLNTIAQHRFETIAKEFNTTWKQALAELNDSIMQSFSNFKNGNLVLHFLLKQLVFTYQKFTSKWEIRFPPNVRLGVQPVLLHMLVVEIKSKYKSNF